MSQSGVWALPLSAAPDLVHTYGRPAQLYSGIDSYDQYAPLRPHLTRHPQEHSSWYNRCMSFHPSSILIQFLFQVHSTSITQTAKSRHPSSHSTHATASITVMLSPFNRIRPIDQYFPRPEWCIHRSIHFLNLALRSSRHHHFSLSQHRQPPNTKTSTRQNPYIHS